MQLKISDKRRRFEVLRESNGGNFKGGERSSIHQRKGS